MDEWGLKEGPSPPIPLSHKWARGRFPCNRAPKRLLRGRGTREVWARLDGWNAPPSPKLGGAGVGGVRAPFSSHENTEGTEN